MSNLYIVGSVNGLLFLISLVFYFFPPKKINALYGYRTNKSMKNEAIWKFANRAFNKSFVIYTAISLVAALLFAATTSALLSWEPMVFLLLSLAAAVIKTENLLSSHFDDEGMPLS